MSRIKMHVVVYMLLFFSISFISIGYAALNTNLTISGEILLDLSGDIYVSNIELISTTDATENFNPTFTDNGVNIGVNVPLASSRFVYEVTIVNSTDTSYYLKQVNELMNSNDGRYFILDMYIYDEFEPNSTTIFQISYLAESAPTDADMVLNLEFIFELGGRYTDPMLNGADPVLIDGIIPIVYDESIAKWVKADVLNNAWYDYSVQQWANGASVIASKREEYVFSEPGTVVELDDIMSMMVWIPRYSYTLRDPYGYLATGGSPLSVATPGAFDIKFHDASQIYYGSGSYLGTTATEYYTPASFCWGNSCDDEATRGNAENTEIPGFWIAKFEASKVNNLLYSKPNMTPMINYTISSTFNYVQELMNGIRGYENYGYIGYVDAHLIKNTEWGAIAYLSQSIYGKYGNPDYSGANKEIYLNNCSTYITGIGGSSASDGRTTATCNDANHAYDSYNGMGASTTGNIYGVYDMIGGTFDRVMGIILDSNGNFVSDLSGFTSLPEGRYINVYPYGTYTEGDISPIKGDGLTETLYFYSDRYLGDPRFSSTNYYLYHWIYRGGSLFFSNTAANGIFSYTLFNGQSDGHHSSRFTITIY